MTGAPDHHHARLVEQYRWLWEAVAAAAGSRATDAPVASVRMPDEVAQRAAVADLLGERRLRAAGARLPTARIEQVLANLDPPTSVAAMVGAVGGYAPSRPDRARAHAAARDELVEELVVRLPAAFTGWARGAARSALAQAGGAHDLAEQERLADRLVAVAHALPAEDIALPAFAQAVTGDTKALDRGTPLGELAVRMITTTPPHDAEAWRAAWADVGVVADTLSSSVLAWRLPLDPATPVGAVAAAYDAANEPCRLTLRVLRHGITLSDPAGTLWVCENPAIVEQVASLGIDTPLLCFEGAATVATRQVVRAFAAAGWRIMVGADLEPGGLAAALLLLADAGDAGQPWRLTATDHSEGRPDERPIPSMQHVPDIPWDPQLTARLRTTRRRVTEEGRLRALLNDLSSSLTE